MLSLPFLITDAGMSSKFKRALLWKNRNVVCGLDFRARWHRGAMSIAQWR